MNTFDFEIEPDADPEPIDDLRGVIEPLSDERALVVAEVLDAEPPPIQQILTAEINLQLILNFLPDVRLKKDLDRAAASALALKVDGAEGISAADVALVDLQERIAFIEETVFDRPCAMANALHKRLTGLRADFIKAGVVAVASLKTSMLSETRRLKALSDQAQRVAQEEANRAAREVAAKAVEKAKQAEAPAPIVAALEKQAQTAVAPPVASPVHAAAPKKSSIAENWKARFSGDESEEPNPATADMNDAQRLQFIALLRAVIDGKAPIGCVDPCWRYLNARAKGDRAAFLIPGVEAYDAGSVRKKAR